jgi:SlyX protein
MNEAETLSARIADLETRSAHQERIIEDLNKSVTEQWKQIESLTKQIGRVTDRMQSIEENSPSSGEVEPPPPHY